MECAGDATNGTDTAEVNAFFWCLAKVVQAMGIDNVSGSLVGIWTGSLERF